MQRKSPTIITATNNPALIQIPLMPPTSFGKDHDQLFKIAIVGAPRAGKSCLLARFVNNSYHGKYEKNIGASFFTNGLHVNNKKINIQTWDFSGDDPYNQNSLYCRGAHAFIAVFDLTDKESFVKTTQIIAKVIESATTDANIILVGAKADDLNQRAVSQAEVDDYLKSSKYKIDAYIEASAQTKENVSDVFKTAAQVVLERKVLADLKKTKSTSHLMPRDALEMRLMRYIDRVKQNPYDHGFWVCKKSRAINREANCKLAESLLTKLRQSPESIDKIFADTDKQRDTIIGANHLFARPDYKKRGMNSGELKDILKTAVKFGTRKG